TRTEPLKPGLSIAAANVFLHPIEVLHGHEQPVSIRVLEVQVLAGLPALADQAHPRKPADAMVDMHHQVAGGKIQLPGAGSGRYGAARNRLARTDKQVAAT